MFRKTFLSLAVLGALVGCNNSNDVKVVNPDIGGGQVLIYTTSGEFIDAANVGNLPDMVKFADDNTLIVANEGEPSDDYTSDPVGSISIITLQANNKIKQVKTLGFEDVVLEGNVRIKPDSQAKYDLEPEYVAINQSGDIAWVTLQENNAIAMVDIKAQEITKVKGLGEIAIANQAIDITDDGVADPVESNPANIFALYQPDTIQSISINGKDYFLTANEGDDREYGDYEDLVKVNKLTLSDQLQASVVAPDNGMEKLRVLKDLGQNESGTYESLYMTGTRSFSIWDEAGNRVFDSGADFETHLAHTMPDQFNTRVDDTDDADDIAELNEDGIAYEMHGETAFFWEGVDARTLKKGAEPEALAVHQIGSRTFAYIGLEKQGGFFIYDISQPADAFMVDYVNNIDYSALPSQAGDLAPEGMVAFSQDHQDYLAIACELSSTLALFSLSENGQATKLTSIKLGDFGQGAAEIVDYSAADKKLFVTNAQTKMVDVVDVSNPEFAQKEFSIDFSDYADDLQSVSVHDGRLAIAVKRRTLN